MADVKVLIIGCGDLGAEIAKRLMQSGLEVLGVRRSVPAVAEESHSQAVPTLSADVTKPETLSVLSSITPEIIVYCVAAGGQTDAEYKAAYVDGLRNVLVAQKHNVNLKHVFFVSSTRVYGQEADAVLDETVPAAPADFGGQRLLEAEMLLQNLPCAGTALRLSGIYGPGRLRMINLAKSPGHWPRQNAWSNRIHRDDAARFVVFLIEKVLAGHAANPCYIVTDSAPVSQYEVLGWIASQLHAGQAEPQPIVGGKRLSNQLLLATGFKLQYADYKAGYQSLLK